MKKCKKILAALAFILCLGMLCNSAMEVQAATKLKAPGNFKGTTEKYNDATMLTITWDAVEGAAYYKVFYRSNVPGEEYFDEWYLVEETTETTSQGSIIDGIFQMKVCAYSVWGDGPHTDVITVLGGQGIIENPELELNEKTLVLSEGEKYQLELINAPGNIKWKSKNEEVVTVDWTGNVTAQGKGKCKIVAKCYGKKYVCKITVKEASRVSLFKGILKNIDEVHKVYWTPRFTLLDINQDGNSELLLHTASGSSSMDEDFWIYTYSNKKLDEECVPAHSEMKYYKDTKCLKNDIWYMGSLGGGGSTEYYKIENGKVVVLEEAECRGKATEITWYDLTEENIKKYCK